MERFLLGISRSPVVPAFRSGWLLVWSGYVSETLSKQPGEVGGPILLRPAAPEFGSRNGSSGRSLRSGQRADDQRDGPKGFKDWRASDAAAPPTPPPVPQWEWRLCRLKANCLFFHTSDHEPPSTCALMEIVQVEVAPLAEAMHRWGAQFPPPPTEAVRLQRYADGSSPPPAAPRGQNIDTVDEEEIMVEHMVLSSTGSGGGGGNPQGSAADMRTSFRWPTVIKLTYPIGAMRNEPPVFLLSPTRSAAVQWVAALRDCTVTEAKRKAEGRINLAAASSGIGSSSSQWGAVQVPGGQSAEIEAVQRLAIKDIRIAELEAEAEKTSSDMSMLKNRVEELTEIGVRLQSAAEVTEKASGEVVEQKSWEVGALQRQTAAALEELGQTHEEMRYLRQKYEELHRDIRKKTAENVELRDLMRQMETDWEDAHDAPGRTLQKLHRLRVDNQSLSACTIYTTV